MGVSAAAGGGLPIPGGWTRGGPERGGSVFVSRQRLDPDQSGGAEAARRHAEVSGQNSGSRPAAGRRHRVCGRRIGRRRRGHEPDGEGEPALPHREGAGPVTETEREAGNEGLFARRGAPESRRRGARDPRESHGRKAFAAALRQPGRAGPAGGRRQAAASASPELRRRAANGGRPSRSRAGPVSQTRGQRPARLHGGGGRHRIHGAIAGILYGRGLIEMKLFIVCGFMFSTVLLGQTKYDLLLQGGHVIDAKNGISATRDVAIKDGKIAAVAAKLDPKDALKSVNVAGLQVV